MRRSAPKALLGIALFGSAFSSPLDHSNALERRIPSAVYGPGDLTVPAGGNPFIVLDNGVSFVYQNSDANFVCYKNGAPVWYSGTHEAATCNAPNNCELAFQSDGNLVAYFNGSPIWYTNTGGGAGKAIQFQDIEPFIFIINGGGSIIWDSGVSSNGGGGGGGSGGNGGSGNSGGDSGGSGSSGSY